LAFAIHLKGADSSAAPEPEKPAQPAATARADTPEAKRPDSPATSSAPSSSSSDAADANVVKQYSNIVVNVPSNDAPAAPRPAGTGPAAWTSQSPDAAHVPAAVAVHEAQPVLPDSPKINTNGEILLHLQGNDQSSAAIRVMDRAGSLNVSVHASDSDLRNTLRSNVGELVSQLNGQGWKTDVDKPALATVRAQTSQDPQSNGQRSPGQQQSSGDNQQQAQRDRRSNSGRWIQELEQQTAGQSSTSGGKN
jgi:hypothetical protein